jgi:dihydrofolate synthase/folylpolyglutamate synthase
MLERLYALSSQKGMVLGLERIERVLAGLGHPERAFPSVHLAGSNGKGSTAAFLASILSQRGRRIGLYTSPHLVLLNERVQVVERGRATMAAPEVLLEAFEAVDRAAPGFEDLTFFEVITAAGLLALARQGVQLGVIESGLGARLDATRLVDAKVSVLTDISLEHTAILGDTLEAIAEEKAHVLRPGRALVAADPPPAARAVIERRAREVGSPLHMIGQDIFVRVRPDQSFDFELGEGRRLDKVRLSLLGPHQGRNALLAIKAATLLDPTITDGEIREALENTEWPGRMEVLRRPSRPPVLLDGAHNAQGAEALDRAIRAHHALFRGPLHFVFGVLADKDASRMLEVLLPLADSIVLTRPDSARARDPEALFQALPKAEQSRANAVESLEAALDLAERRAMQRGGWVVVAGSLYLVGEARRRLRS